MLWWLPSSPACCRHMEGSARLHVRLLGEMSLTVDSTDRPSRRGAPGGCSPPSCWLAVASSRTPGWSRTCGPRTRLRTRGRRCTRPSPGYAARSARRAGCWPAVSRLRPRRARGVAGQRGVPRRGRPRPRRCVPGRGRGLLRRGPGPVERPGLGDAGRGPGRRRGAAAGGGPAGRPRGAGGGPARGRPPRRGGRRPAGPGR